MESAESKYVRAALVVFVYVASEGGLYNIANGALHQALHSHAGRFLDEHLLVVELMIRSVAIPLILGFACGAILMPKTLRAYWPIILAPFVAGIVKIVFGQIPLTTVSDFAGSVTVIGAATFASAVAFVGARMCAALMDRYSRRHPSAGVSAAPRL